LESLESRLPLAALPAGFNEALVASSLSSPTTMELSPDGKMFVAEQGGTMEVWQNGAQLRANFFANSPLTVNSSGERGLLGVAFDPNYATNRFIYVYYTATTPTIHNRISRFTANTAGDLAIAGSETVLMDLETLSATNHNGGAIHFGVDGRLYVGVGENAVPNNSQTINNRLGKILRINTDPANVIPSDNPTSFAGISGSPTGVNRAIWAVGLRNPYAFAVQPGTGVIYINDVGAGTWEEINQGVAGANYGWPATEGAFNPSTFPNFTNPLLSYPHGGGSTSGCAITGGAFYNPSTAQFPSDYTGDYFFGDF
jgi:glucose/arabinose dehydrogenase